jgi:hypothetical protein
MMFKTATTLTAFLVFIGAVHTGIKRAYLDVIVGDLYPVTRDRAFEQRDDVRALLLGNSLVQLDIVPIENTANLASFDESYSTTYYRLRDILRRDDLDIETVLMQLSLHSFRGRRPADTQQVYFAQIIDYWDLMRVTDKPIAMFRDMMRYRVFPYAGGVGPTLKYFSQPRAQVGQERSARVAQRFSDSPAQESEALASALNLFKPDETLSDFNADYLKRILDLCADNDIQVVLVKFPVTRAHYDQITQMYDTEAWDRIVETHVSGRDHVTVIDLLELYFDDYAKFMDPVHLNTPSKEAFTEHLLEELRRRNIPPFDEVDMTAP